MKIEEIVKELEESPIEKKGQLYHPIPFEEFSHLSTSSSKSAIEKKWSLIKNCAEKVFEGDFNGKKIVDIGANAGFYSFNFAKLGCEIQSFEREHRYSKYAKSIIEHKNLNIKWHEEYFDSNHLNDQQVDLTLMLSVYQWMAEGGEKMEYAQNALRKVSQHSKYLIFELGFNKGKSHIKTEKLNHYSALVHLLKENSEYTHFKLLGKTRLWRYYSRFLVLCSKDANFEDTGIRKWLSK